MHSELVIQILTVAALAGLLAAVGLRLRPAQVIDAIVQCRLTPIFLSNFVGVPLLTVAALKAVEPPRELSIGMILLAAAPFAPVVPVFARLAQADIALAAGLSTVFPLVSVGLTPLVAALALKALPNTGAPNLSVVQALLTLSGTIIFPVILGLVFRQKWPALALAVVKPIEVVSEAAGACSLAFVTITHFSTILNTGWTSLVVMIVVFEMSFGLGWTFGAEKAPSRQVIGLGTSNRNIALALLIALQSFPDTEVPSAVVTNGLVLIALGLVHVGFWRLKQKRSGKSTPQS